MAYFQNQNQKKTEQDSNLGGQPMPQSQSYGSQSSEIGGGNAAQPGGQAQQSQTPTAGSGRFQNLQNFVTANQGAAGNLGQKIGQTYSRQAEDIGKAVQSAQSKAQGLGQQEQERLGQTEGLATSARTQATDITGDQGRQDAFKQIYGGQYNQNINLGDTSGVQQNIQNIQQAAQKAQTEQGRFGLLQQTFGLPGYSRGAQNLDQLLLQADPTATRQLGANIGQSAQGAQGQLGTAQQQISDLQAKIAQEAQTAQGTLKGATTEGYQAAEQGAAARVGQYNTQMQALVGDLAKGFTSGTLSKAAFEQLDPATKDLVMGAVGKQLGYSGDYSSRLGLGAKLVDTGLAGKQQLASDQEIANQQALDALTGQTKTNLAGATNRLQLGQYAGGQLGLDANDLNQTVLQNRADLNQAAATAAQQQQAQIQEGRVGLNQAELYNYLKGGAFGGTGQSAGSIFGNAALTNEYGSATPQAIQMAKAQGLQFDPASPSDQASIIQAAQTYQNNVMAQAQAAQKQIEQQRLGRLGQAFNIK